MRTFRFHAVQRIERPLAEVFPFFADARNLEAITPPWLRFAVLGTTDETVREGTEIDYRLCVRGVPIRWRSRISRWDPPRGFADEQLVGPYRRWYHLHTFHEDCGATIAEDLVEYAVPGGPLIERVVERLVVRPDIERIFAWRRRRIAERFETPRTLTARATDAGVSRRARPPAA